jgi:hypothetical protein
MECDILRARGRITPEAAQGATHIPLGKKPIGNPQVIKVLTSDGSHINDWGKFYIDSVKLSSGEGIQLHFYKNLKTGVVDYVTKDIRITKVIE